MTIYRLPEKISALIFDIDSTLYTCPEYAREQIDSQIRYFAQQHDMDVTEARNLVRDYRKKWAQDHDGQKISLGNLLTAFGVSIEDSIEWRKFLFDPADYLQKDDRLRSTLLELKNNYKLLCVTNNPKEPAVKTLEVLGVADIITDIIALDTCFKSKPALEPFELAVRHAGVPTEECVSIGDRFDIDIALPLAMGMGGIEVSGVEEVYQLPDTFKKGKK